MEIQVKQRPAGRLRVAHITTIDLTLWFMLRTQLKRLIAEGYEVSAISAPGDRVADLEADGVRHIPWRSATRGWNLVADVRAFAELVRILRRERFDIVHTHNPKPGVLGRIAARLAGVPCVVNTQHGLYAMPEDRPARKGAVLALEWISARFSDSELYQSEEDLVWATRLGVARPPKAVLLGNGIDLERFSLDAVPPERMEKLRADLGIPDGALVIGTVGRLVAEKGYRELFTAAAAVREANPDTVFLVVGGPDPEKWDSIPPDEMSRARDHTIFAGHREDVRDLLAIMDVFVLASWREGLPRSAIEAAAMARPLVLTDIRGCREVVRDGIEGLLVPPRNPSRLAAAIVRLAGDAALRARFGAAARTRACQRFDEAKVEDIVVREYRRVFPNVEGTGSEDAFRVRLARRSDIPALVRLHRETVPTAFLPTLGDRFMRVLYRALLKDPGGVAAVVEDGDGRVVALASGAISVPAFYRRFFRRHGVAAALSAAPRLIRPWVLKRAFETARFPKSAERFPEAEIFVWGVDRSVRARGLGIMVLDEATREMGRRGVSEARGIVYAENDRARKVLIDSGWRIVGEVSVHDGRTSVVVVRPCPS
jgi:glycosyltransferase involved in cell wall biosynthesis/ribosomal protein S18 acetylase RimI-like enzyme